jgi:hypothetical protein
MKKITACQALTRSTMPAPDATFAPVYAQRANSAGEVFSGTFQNDLLEGFGSYTDKYGNRYEGNFIKGKLNGSCEIHFLSGHTLIMQMLDGFPVAGPAQFSEPDGLIVSGQATYSDGQMILKFGFDLTLTLKFPLGPNGSICLEDAYGHILICSFRNKKKHGFANFYCPYQRATDVPAAWYARHYAKGVEHTSLARAFIGDVPDCISASHAQASVCATLEKQVDTPSSRALKPIYQTVLSDLQQMRNITKENYFAEVQALAQSVKTEQPVHFRLLLNAHILLLSFFPSGDGTYEVAIFNSAPHENVDKNHSKMLRARDGKERYSLMFSMKSVSKTQLEEPTGLAKLLDVFQENFTCAAHSGSNQPIQSLYEWLEALNNYQTPPWQSHRFTTLQTMQRSNTCALECFNAYLKNRMIQINPENGEIAYHTFRLKMFEEELLNLKKIAQDETLTYDPREIAYIIQRLEQKIKRRQQRLNTLEAFRAIKKTPTYNSLIKVIIKKWEQHKNEGTAYSPEADIIEVLSSLKLLADRDENKREGQVVLSAENVALRLMLEHYEDLKAPHILESILRQIRLPF